MVKFMRTFFNNTLKSNPYIEKALLTGITRVSKESMFSDMNNLYAASITTHRYETAFGFTEAEVFAALDHAKLGKYKKRVKQWYDGFVIGRCRDIYNPWSITRFIDFGGEFDTYWANTSSNNLVSSLISKGSRTLKCAMEDLMNGIPVEADIEEMNYYMNMVTNMTFSYFDCGSGYGIIDETERFYHGFAFEGKKCL